MRTFLQDFRYALRVLRKNLTISVVIVASLAVGIGANSAVFSVVDALLLRSLPYPQPDRLADVWLHSPRIGIRRDWPSPGEYIDIQNENHSFEHMALAPSRNLTLTDREQPELVGGMRTQSSLFEMLGAKPQLGRLLLPEEDKPGKPAVAILSDRIWKRLFNSDRSIIGKTIVLSGSPYVVAGVLEPGFTLSAEVMTSEVLMDKVDIFLPLPLGADAANDRLNENYNIMVKLKPGVSLKQSQSDIDVIAARIRQKDRRDSSFGMDVVGLQQQVVGDVRLALLVVFGSAGLVLLIACTNVASLLLTRAVARQKEIAIRTALGAGWQRLTRQLLTESILLGVLGGGAGLLVAELGLFVMRAVNPGNIPRFEDVAINGAVVAFAVGISLTTGILFGIAPARCAVKIDLNSLLKAGGRGGQSDGGLYLRRHSMRALLIVSELSLSLMLLIGAGLLIRTFLRLQNVHLGFNADHVLTMEIATTAPKYRDPKAVVSLYQQFQNGIDNLPGVVSEGVVYPLPLTGAVSWGVINVEGYTPPAGEQLQFDLRVASTDYFRTMQIPLLKGRFFTVHDTADMPQVAAIDERFARRFWPDGDPLGKHLSFDPKKPLTIVGVVGSVKQYGLDTDGKLVVYVPGQGGSMFLAVRTSTDPAAMSSAVVGAIHTVDPSVLVYGVRTMQGRLSDALARQRFVGTILGAFALFALLLAAVGLYGLLSHLVTQSTHDIGLLAALGARPGNIFRLVLRQGMALAAIGILVGLAASAALTRVMASLLFSVSTTDAVTFGVVTGLLPAVAVVATVIPAWRASGVDPGVALRQE